MSEFDFEQFVAKLTDKQDEELLKELLESMSDEVILEVLKGDILSEDLRDDLISEWESSD